MTERVSVRLLDRLRLEGFIPVAADCELSRVRPSREQRELGQWSWRVCFGFNGIMPFKMGSPFPMALCVKADRVEACHGAYGYLTLMPVNDENIREK